MQIDRLFQIVQILLHQEQVTAKELAERFDVSTRTIYRDVDTLSINGVPIYATKGKGGGIRLMDHYIMDRSVLSVEEQNNLMLGLETLKATNAEDVDEVIGKLKSLFHQDQDSWIRVDFSHWGNDPLERKKFENVKEALISYRQINFDYYDAYGNKTERKAYPKQLLFKEKAWYLVAYCLAKESFRFFKLLRMENVELRDQHFDSSKYVMDEDPLYEAPSRPATEFRFWLSKDIRYRIYDEFGKEQITRLEDGNFEATYYGVEDDWLYNFILSFGEHIEVLEPLRVREIIGSKIKIMWDKYQ